MNWTPWLQHFEQNAQRPELVVRLEGRLTPRQVHALRSSLAKFQLGEAGEGRIANEIDHVQLADIDDVFRAALKKFIREEGRHARVLAKVVQALDGKLLARQWTERAFVHLRRLFGVRFKLLVLLVSEVIGGTFYDLVSERLEAAGAHSFAAALRQMRDDEAHHLQFQSAFFRSRAPGWLGPLLRVAWWPLAMGAVMTLLVDQREVFAALGLRRVDVARRYLAAIASTAKLLQRRRDGSDDVQSRACASAGSY